MTHLEITISKDKVIAHFSGQTDDAKTKDELVGEILLLLETKGVVYGISESMIENAVDNLITDGQVDDVVVAIGEHPGKSQSTGPVFTVPTYTSKDISEDNLNEIGNSIHYYDIYETLDSPYIVKKGEVVGVDENHNGNSKGVDIFGNSISPSDSGNPFLTLKSGFDYKENDDIISTIEGIVYISNNEAKIIPIRTDGDVRIKISEDCLSVYIDLYPAAMGGKKLTINDVHSSLAIKNVKFGIKRKFIEESVKKVNESEVPIKNLEVAKGESPIEGENGKIKYLVNLSFSHKPSIDSNGKADYYKIHKFENVKINQPLAKILPPKPGESGKDVFGIDILPKEIKDEEISAGNNVTHKESDPNILVSKITGHVYLKDNQLVVARVLKISGNVDFSTGNINFDGDVEIKGDVLTGFKVRAFGSVVISGTVEDAVIRADDSVIIKGGFIGRGLGRIKAGKDVVVNHVRNQTILAQNDIMVAGEALDSKLYAGNEMFVEIKKSWIIGGCAVAKNRIYANALGNTSGVQTEVYCGTGHFIKKILDELAIEIVLLEEDAALIIEKMRHPEIDEIDVEKDPEYLESLSIQLKDIKRRQDVKHNKLKTFRTMYKSMDLDFKGEVGVRECIYPGVNIKICDHKYSVVDEMKEVLFYYFKDQIKIRPFL